MRWSSALAERLGAERVLKDEQWAVKGTLGEVDYGFIGDEAGPEKLFLYYSSEKSRSELRKDLSESLELQAAFAAAWQQWRESALSLGKTRLSYNFGEALELEPDKLESLLKAMVDQLEPIALDRCCSTCGETNAPLCCSDLGLERICETCLVSREEELKALDLSFLEDMFKGFPLWILVDSHAQLDFEAESSRLQEEYETDRARFWRKLLLWVLLGQIALSATLVFTFLLIGMFSSLVFLVFHFKLGGVVYWIVKLGGPKLLAVALLVPILSAGLWQSLQAGLTGLKVSPKELPGKIYERHHPQAGTLFSWLDELSRRTQAPKLHRIVVTAECNAFATEMKEGRKRLLVAGLGLPLVELLSREELESILIHELAHLKHEDTKRLWVHRTVEAWREVARASLGQAVLGLPARFCGWFFPRFLLRAKVISRGAERMADLMACQDIGPEAVAATLAKVRVFGELYHEQRELVVSSLVESEEPLQEPVDLLLAKLSSLSQDKIQEVLKLALEEEPSWLDSHPTLTQRLENLGVRLPERLLLERAENWITELVDDFYLLKREAYSETTAYIQMRVSQERRNRACLDAQLERCPPEAHLRRAGLLKDLGRHAEALEQCEARLKHDPQHISALLLKAEVLCALGRKDEALPLLLALKEKRMLDETYVLRCLLEEVGQADAAEELREKNHSIRPQESQAKAFAEPPPQEFPGTWAPESEKVSLLIPSHPSLLFARVVGLLISFCWVPLSLWALVAIYQRFFWEKALLFSLLGFGLVWVLCYSLFVLRSAIRHLCYPLKIEASRRRVVLSGAINASLHGDEVIVSHDKHPDFCYHRLCLASKSETHHLAQGYSAREIRWLFRVLRHYLYGNSSATDLDESPGTTGPAETI